MSSDHRLRTPPDCDHANGDHSASHSNRVALVAELCRERGVRLTPLRRQILELLLENCRPMGAYELIEALQRICGRPVAPPTVYRSLKFLVTQRFVSKLETCNSYVTCNHPELDHDSLFLICDGCGASIELEDPDIERQLAADAERLGFRTMRSVVEIQGTCASCQGNDLS